MAHFLSKWVEILIVLVDLLSALLQIILRDTHIKIVDLEDSHAGIKSKRSTAFVGTVGYRAPEVYSGECLLQTQLF